MVGVAMFGTIAFIPLYLQVVQGVSPATSGLFLTPMMAGLITSSFGAGQIMARTGRYKILPTLSTALLSGAMLTLSTLGEGSSLALVALAMVCVGLGLGPVFSIGVSAIQNAVPRQMLGVGTASANMFRLIGGAVGTAAFGALFGKGLSSHVGALMPEGVSVRSLNAELIASLPPEVAGALTHGFAQALHPIFWIAAGLALLACLTSMRLQEVPLDGARSPGGA